MKFFNKTLGITFVLFCLILCISIYFFTKDKDYEFLSQNELYVSENSEQISTEISLIYIHIDGAILYPGLITLPVKARISDAIEAAGGITNLADLSKINLAYELKDGQKIYIPTIYDNDTIQYIQDDAGSQVLVLDDSASSNLININSATQLELETLPGIGAATALKIIDYRNKHGDFKKIEDIMNISGIGEAKFNSIKDFICI